MGAGKIKTLVILTPGFPADEADSACVPPQQIFVKALAGAAPGLKIVVLTFQYPFHSKSYKWQGISVFSFGNKYNSRLMHLFTGLRVWLKLLQLKRDYNLVGLLSFWLGKCALTGSWFAQRYGLKHYCWILGQDAKAGNKYVRKINPAGESLIALSDFIVRELNKNYQIKPAHIIPVGLDTTLFKNEEIRKDIDILGAGSLIPLKQYEVFLEIVKTLKTPFPAIKAVICGDGPEMGRLTQMVGALNLTAHVTLTGTLPHTEVLAMMQRSRIFLHTSNYEGFGAVCLEALYAGAIVVSFVKPMDTAIPNWHFAANKEDMLNILHHLAFNPPQQHQPVLPYPIEDNAKKMLKLFGQSEPAIS